MIKRVAFASCYVYSPSGTSAVCARSRLLCSLLKAGDARYMIKYAVRVHQLAVEPSRLAGFFCSTDVFVPVPRSVSGSSSGTWVAADLAHALVQEGLGAMTWPGLHRISAVRKSATSAPGERPSVALHYASFSMDLPPVVPTTVVLVDDVITRGRTLLAAASRVREALPGTNVRAFALVRTMGQIAGVPALLDPCTGEIRWRAGDAQRYP
jgi:predicted amidophosphoribosyltransferase